MAPSGFALTQELVPSSGSHSQCRPQPADGDDGLLALALACAEPSL